LEAVKNREPPGVCLEARTLPANSGIYAGYDLLIKARNI